MLTIVWLSITLCIEQVSHNKICHFISDRLLQQVYKKCRDVWPEARNLRKSPAVHHRQQSTAISKVPKGQPVNIKKHKKMIG